MIKVSGRLQLSLIFIFITLTTLRAQLAPGSLKSENPTFSHQYTFLNAENYYFIDTTFNSLHWYHQFNQADRDLFGYARLGNMGAPLNPLTAQPLQDIWQYMNSGVYQPYLKRNNDIPLYYVRSPLTEATYWMGYQRGQSFNFYHTQNINKNWNFLVSYKNLNATGDYLRNYNRHFTFLANTHYRNEKLGYQAYFHFLTEKLTNQENGGIRNDSIFESNAVTAQPRTLMEVNLPSDRRTVINREALLNHSYNLARLWQTPDSLGNYPDKGFLKLGHRLKYNRQVMTYEGNGVSEFYPDYFFTDGEYKDSISYRSLENTLFIATEVGSTVNMALKGGIRNLITSYGNDYFRLNTNNWGLVSELQVEFTERMQLEAALDYILIGPLDQSLDLRGNLDLRLYRNIHLTGGARLQSRNPFFYQQTYYSNNYIWLNNFDKEINAEFFAGLRWQGNNYLRVSNSLYDNRVYFDADATPVQASALVYLFRAELNQSFRIWNFIKQENTLIYQRSDNQVVLPLPDYVGRHSLYFIYELFGGVLKCQTGAELNYFSSYNSPSYNPATGVFYNAAEKEIGNYPLVDVFANFKLRKTIFFVKLEHANEGFNGYRYYAAPDYPFPDRTIRVGISWRFFN